jgi:hypothetical protein
LLQARGDQYQSLAGISAFESVYSVDGLCTQWIATEPVDGFSWVGDDTALSNAMNCIAEREIGGHGSG